MNKTIFMAAGGSGGHIYPAVAVARSILKKQSDYKIHFIGTSKGIENKIVPKEGFELHHVPIGRFNKNVNIKERFLTLLMLPWAFIKSFFLLKKYKPELVLGTGGYTSVPVLFVASLLKIKTVIWEPNAVPGMANRFLSKYVDECLVVFDEAKPRLQNERLLKLGYPLRPDFENERKKEEINERSDQLLKILIFGGSQGARGINNIVSQAVGQGGEWLDHVELIHQTGKYDFKKVKSIYDKVDFNVKCYEYLDPILKHINWSDVVVSRSGAGTVSELSACGKASLLVPLPTAADNHQKKNAQVLKDAGAADMLVQNEFTVDSFIHWVQDLKNDKNKISGLSKNIKIFYKPNSAEKMADHLLSK